MKPEKVKSRWRRNSELDAGNKSDTPMGIDIEKSLTMKEKLISDMKNEANVKILGADSEKVTKMIVPTYEHLDENLYLSKRKRTKRKKEVRRMLCDCSLTEEEKQMGIPGCQDECLNRLLMIECGSRCPTGDACSNKRFQKNLYAKVEPFKTEKKGYGLKVLEDVPAGNFVIEYVGEVLNTQEFKQRVKQYARGKSRHYYFMTLKSDEILDATNKGNLSRFINHSCDPNCVTQKWTVNGELRIGFFAKKTIKAGEELTFDYQFQRYGREAQKCFCESQVCSGFIGVSNKISLDINTNKSGKRKKISEEKKEDLEDLILEEEIEKLSENGCLRNKEETLLLARLMVRAEDVHSREKLLDILLGTSEHRCLRSFLDYHGLSLLWSWMVDLNELKLKTKILHVLSQLPVPNKTMLLNSKVFNVVERWASLQSKDYKTEISSSLVCDKMSNPTSDSDTPLTSDLEENIGLNGNAEVTCRSDDESIDITDERISSCDNGEFFMLANNLLSSWKELKDDDFRIPRQNKLKQIHKKSTQTLLSRHKNMCKSCRRNEASFCTHHSRKEKTWKKKSRKNAVERKRKYCKTLLPTPGDFSSNVSNFKYPPIVTSVLTKEERREQFARTVEQHDKIKKDFQQEQYVINTNLTINNTQYNTNSDNSISNVNTSYINNVNSTHYSFTESNNGNTSSDTYYSYTNMSHPGLVLSLSDSVEEHTLHISSRENTYNLHPDALYQPSQSQMSFVGTPLHTVSHQTSLQTSNIHTFSSLPDMVNLKSICVPALTVTNRKMNEPSRTIIHPSVLYSSDENINAATFNYLTSSENNQGIPIHNLVSSEKNDQNSYYPTNQFPIQVPNCLDVIDNKSLFNITALRLPPFWRTATDAEGNVYYYHMITRQTQWDPPTLETVEYADEETPTYDEPKERKHYEKHSRRSHKKHSKKRSTTTFAADTSTAKISREVAKKIKELFRTKMSAFVVQCLNPYHRDDCRVGKITSNEDFKHLARKLTHFIMAKELKHCKHVEDLDCNDSVKHKARDFIHKYMVKFGPYYKKGKFDSLIVF